MTYREAMELAKIYQKEIVNPAIEDAIEELKKITKKANKRESIKTDFTLEDLKDKELIIPCNNCNYVNDYPVCSDGATSSACNHCAFAILDNVYNKKEIKK